MSHVSTKLKSAALPKRGMSPAEEEEFYFRDTHPGTALVSVDHIEVDRMCSLCGHWKSEHPWESCPNPNWLD